MIYAEFRFKDGKIKTVPFGTVLRGMKEDSLRPDSCRIMANPTREFYTWDEVAEWIHHCSKVLYKSSRVTILL